jgi:hypothetical protein
LSIDYDRRPFPPWSAGRVILMETPADDISTD